MLILLLFAFVGLVLLECTRHLLKGTTPPTPKYPHLSAVGPGASLELYDDNGKILYKRTNPSTTTGQRHQSYVTGFGAAGPGARVTVHDGVLSRELLKQMKQQ